MPNRVAAHVTSYLSKADIEDQGLDVDSYAVYHPSVILIKKINCNANIKEAR